MRTIDVKYIDTRKYIAKISYCDWAESPTDWGNFSVVQFRDNDWTDYASRDDYSTESGKILPSLQAKMRAGKVFTLTYRRYSSADGGIYTVDGGLYKDIDEVDGFIEFDDEYIKNTSYEDVESYIKEVVGDADYSEEYL